MNLLPPLFLVRLCKLIGNLELKVLSRLAKQDVMLSILIAEIEKDTFQHYIDETMKRLFKEYVNNEQSKSMVY